MKKVCGTCIFGVDSKVGRSGINVFCAYDSKWHAHKTEGCSKWRETKRGLSKKNKIDLANSLKVEEGGKRRHWELLRDSRANRKTLVILAILGALVTAILAVL
ncbi:MAG: hypothetical protein JXB49_21610 [Bacteroidales bacterium]|nr:hypothetical protein [Bacteroidales bacterium]